MNEFSVENVIDFTQSVTQNDSIKKESRLDAFKQQIGNDHLSEKIFAFIAKKSQIFNSQTDSFNAQYSIASPCNLNDLSDNKLLSLQVETAPLETFMKIPNECKKEHLLEYLEPGDEVIGSVEHLDEHALHMLMVCFANHKRRDLTNLNIKLICSANEAMLKLSLPYEKLKKCYTENDFVKCIIKKIDKTNKFCEVDLCPGDDSVFALVASDKMPIHYKSIESFNKEAYLYNKYLKKKKNFHNPSFIQLMCNKLNINTKSTHSLMKGINSIEIDKQDMASELYKRQNKNLALQSVQRGICFFKENKLNEAKQSYEKAISIDEECVEAFVARGALFANEGSFTKAIDDFEKAISLDSQHANAKNYLKEVFLAYAVKFEKAEKLNDSLAYLNKALKIEPKNALIENKINQINEKIKEAYEKSRYGPSLPASSASSFKAETPSKQKHLSKNSNRSSIGSNVVKSNKNSYKSSDEEDLEDFFDKLKRNKAMKK